MGFRYGSLAFRSCAFFGLENALKLEEGGLKCRGLRSQTTVEHKRRLNRLDLEVSEASNI